MHIRLVAVIAMLVWVSAPAFAQSSLGIGSAEQIAVPTDGWFAGFFQWVGNQQREFYREMTTALRDMREDGSAFWLLVGLSFLYGILHAAGPGHGKIVISSYMLANETALKRGILLSFASSALQAVSAIVIVGTGFLVLRGTSISMTDASVWLEKASYFLVIVFGLWLLWRKSRSMLEARAKQVGESVNAFYHPEVAHAHAHSHEHNHSHEHDHSHEHHAHSHGDTAAHAHTHEIGDVCSTCGHAHMPMPSQLEGKMDLRAAFGAVFSVGLRPCTGAIVVMSFAILNGLYLAGIASVFAMALGTAITVSTLATIAVTAKNTALRYSGSAMMSTRLQTGIEIFGASTLVVLGSVMFAGALAV